MPFKQLAEGNDAAIFIADLHALTSVKDGERLRAQSLELAIEYLSIFGKDTPITIFRQSDIADITKLMWVLTNVTPFSLMARAHSYKDFTQHREEIISNLSNARGHLEMYEALFSDLSDSKKDKWKNYIDDVKKKIN